MTDLRKAAQQALEASSKSQQEIASFLADEIKAVMSKPEGLIALSLAIGVLRIAEKELLDDA